MEVRADQMREQTEDPRLYRAYAAAHDRAARAVNEVKTRSGFRSRSWRASGRRAMRGEGVVD